MARKCSRAPQADAGGSVSPVTTTTDTARGRAVGASAARPSAISARNLSKSFRLPRENARTLKERALHPLRTRIVDTLHAVDDVSIEIAEGEFFGIVGSNGSGKSTLLKCIAGIYETDGGELHINGRLAPFIELGVGFNPELTATDNAIINAIMLGLTRREALERFDEIVAFAELHEFMNLKLKNFSSGMHVRLAFAVAIQVNADILLIDEVLAVGDAAFQQKCFDEFARLKRAGKTIVFVTHDMSSVERFCDRAMLLDHGRMIDIGDPATVARHYTDVNFRAVREHVEQFGGPATMRGTPVAQVRDARFESEGGTTVHEAIQGDPLCIRLEVHFHAEVEDPVFTLELRNSSRVTAFAVNSAISHGPLGRIGAGTTVVLRLRFENSLAPGPYGLTTSVGHLEDEVMHPYDAREGIASILVHATSSGGGVADLPHTVTISRE
jgi:ABC-type polysaccharide/polyol phosphate transport system ATPase subunit